MLSASANGGFAFEHHWEYSPSAPYPDFQG